ncbi:MAG: DUF748 domain-containing protein [Desulfohalobiaceae bacterium]|nr:DUF748 domain-containing protein [Desulfohalobiaceae bacterium]
MRIKRIIWPANRLQRMAVVIAGAVILYTLLGFFLVPRIIQHVATSSLTAKLDRQASIERVRFNPYNLSCEISGLSIAQKNGEGSWVEIERFLVNLQASSAYKRALIVSRLRVDHPRLSIIRNADQSYNFSDLLGESPESTPQEEESGSFRFSVNNMEIRSGEVEFIDQPADTRHKLSDFSFSLPAISNFPYDAETFVEPSISGRINDTAFDLGGQSKPFAQSRQSRFELDVEELSLARYTAYLPGDRNFNLDRGKLSTDITVAYALPEQEAPYLRLDGTMELQGLEMALRGELDRELITVPRIGIELGGGNLLRGDLQLDAVRIQEPSLDLTRRENGELFLPNLGGAPDAREAEEAPSARQKGDGFFTFGLDRLELTSGRVRFEDASTSPAFTTTLQPLRLSLENLQTGSDDEASFELDMRTGSQENISINGSLGLSRGELKTEVRLSDLLLSRYAPYYGPYIRGAITGGTCDLDAEIAMQWAQGLEMDIREVALGIEGLSADDAQGRRVLSLKELSLRRGRVLSSEKVIDAGSIRLVGGEVRVVQDRNGSLNLAQLAAAGSPEPAPGNAAREGASGSWQFGLDELVIAESGTTFVRDMGSADLEMRVPDISCRLENLSNLPGEEAGVDATLQLENEGSLRAQGSLSLSPLETGLDIRLSNLDLRPFGPVIRNYAELSLNRGALDLTGRLALNDSGSEGGPSIAFEGDIAIRNLKTTEAAQGREFLGWKGLWLRNLAFDSALPSLHVGEMELEGLDTQMIVYPDGGSNMDRVFPAKVPAEEDGEAESAKGSRMRFAIDTVKLDQGRLGFEDGSVSPPFQTAITGMRCRIENLSNQQKQPSDIFVQANIDESAPLAVNGSMNFLGERFFADLDLDLSNISLSPLSAYSGKYMGYAINKGKFFLDSQIVIDGSKLESDHSLLLDQFNLGEKVDSPQAVKAPVKLGIALLKNRKGEIRINKSVGGDLSDPEFSVADLVMRVFVNVLIKAAKSPFSILGAMFDWRGDDINRIPFAPGESGLDQDAEEKLRKLGQALYERPELEVDVLGRADTSKDRAALREARFRRLLREQKYMDLSEEEKSEKDLDEVRLTEKEYSTYLWRAYKEAPLEKPTNALGFIKKLPPEELEERLRDSVSVSGEDLRQLAADRARRVLEFLQEEGPVSPERLFRQSPELGSDQEGSFAMAEIRIH